MYSFSIRQFICEYIGDFIFSRESFTVCIRFQLGNSFVNTISDGDFFFWKVHFMYSFSIRQFICEYIGDFFPRKFPLCNRFQLGNSFVNT